MLRRNNKRWAMLVLVLFVTGFAACLLACHEEETDCGVLQCACHESGVPTTATRAPQIVGQMDYRPADELLKLPLVADSIFQPPRA